MTRKAIPEETQTSILLRSRRRCCLCFWLKGEDEVKKGQFAHLDGDHENSAEENLAFLCFEHHDEYDSTTRLSKGLREKEVKRWRDELYREMQYRFKTIKVKSLQLRLVRLMVSASGDGFLAAFRLTNVGEAEVRSPMVSFRLTDGMRAKPPQEKIHLLYNERQEDFFEAGGKVVVARLQGALNPILVPDHSAQFNLLYFPFSVCPLGSQFSIEYRVDGEELVPFKGKLEVTVPDTVDEMPRKES